MANMRELRFRGGCYRNIIAVVHFDMETVTPENAMRRFASEFPDRVEGYDCETCGYDFPDWDGSADVSDDHEHSVDTCGHEADYRKDQLEADRLAYPDYESLPMAYCCVYYLYPLENTPDVIYR